jgi:hypothetical protein
MAVPSALALSIVLASQVPPLPAPQGPGAAEDELARQCRELRDGSLPFYGRAGAVELERRLAAPGIAATQQLELGAQLAQELLHLGDLERAIAVATPAYQALRSEDGDTTLRGSLLSTLILAHLRAGEDRNCVLHGSAQSCILPIAKDAVHRFADHARMAGNYALDLLALEPSNTGAAWILNLARMLSGDHPQGVPPSARLPADAFQSKVEFPAWRDRSRDLGLDVVDLAGGAVIDDFDGDGLLDIVTSTWDPCDSLKAYRNDGRGGFENTTVAWGLERQLGGLNLVHADFDGDGALDLLVLRGGWLFEEGRMRKSLLHNELGGEAGRFVDVTDGAGLTEPKVPSQTAAWADYDGDGDLDLYVGNERGEQGAFAAQLFRNEGGGRFTDVAKMLGVENGRFAKGVSWGDIDNDGDPDLYVSNHGLNRLYRNDGGRFVDVARELGVEGPDGFTFATWFFDVDNDGDLDLFVADYSATTERIAASYFGVAASDGHPLLFRNDLNELGRFTEVAVAWGLARPQLPMGANFGDLDNDGFLDLYLGTGEPSFQSQIPNVMFRNRGGSGFDDVTFAGGFGHLQKGHGVAFGDVDNDGDQDLFHQLGGFYPADGYRNALFENPGGPNHWLTLRLVGRRANRYGIGARVEARLRGTGGPRSVHGQVGSGGSFGGSSLQLELGLGDAASVDELIVRWPGSGLEQRFRAVAADRFYRLTEGAPALEVVELPRIELGGDSD